MRRSAASALLENGCRRSGSGDASLDKFRLAQHSGGTMFGFLLQPTSPVALAGWARMVMVLLRDNFTVFNEKCVEDI